MVKKLSIIAGNCILENQDISVQTLEFLLEQAELYDFELIYKSSFKKDNRSSASYYTGPALDESAQIFTYLKDAYAVKLITDFHNLYELDHEIVDSVDILQVPAYLCMQTELILAMARTGKTINIKKGQFLHPEDVKKIVKKVESTGNHRILLTERGTCFGYRDLVLDPRSLYILKQMGYPVFFDAGHSVRKYGVPSSDLEKGGAKEYVSVLASAAIASGSDGIFVEVHPEPSTALCDAATQLSFDEFRRMMDAITPIWQAVTPTETGHRTAVDSL